MDLGTALLDRRDAVGLLNRVRDRAVADDAPVDEDVLRTAHRALLAERRDEPADGDAGGLLRDRHEVGPVAVDLIEALVDRSGRRRLEQHALAALQDEADLRIAERELGDQPRDLRGLGGVRLQELPPRRQVEEQIGDFDQRAFRRADLAGRQQPRRLRCAARCRRARRARACAGGTATPTRSTAALRRETRASGSPRDPRPFGSCSSRAARSPARRRRRVIPSPSSSTGDQLLAAELDGDRDARGAGVDGVLDELLDDRRRPLDDLAGGDLVGQLRRQPMNAVHSQSIRRNIQSISAGHHEHDADDPPELRRVAAGKLRQVDVHAEHAGQHGQRHEDRRDHGQHLHDLIQAIRLRRQVRVEQPGHPVLQEQRLVGQPHEVIVDVAEPVRQRSRRSAGTRAARGGRSRRAAAASRAATTRCRP